MTESEFEELEIRHVGRIKPSGFKQLPESYVHTAIEECERARRYFDRRLVHLAALLSVSTPTQEN